MASEKEPVPESEYVLFRQAVEDVEPLSPKPGQQRPHAFSQKSSRFPRQSTAVPSRNDDAFSDWTDSDNNLVGNEEVLAFRRSGIQKRLFSRLKAGQIPVEAELDLHGFTTTLARQTLATFLAQCRQAQLRCIRIIHGKGWSSKDHRPILKTKVNSWLKQDETILAFCSATPQDGGTGAVYVLLKRQHLPHHK